MGFKKPTPKLSEQRTYQNKIDTPVSIVLFSDRDFAKCLRYPPGKFRLIRKGHVENGEGVVLKQMHPSLKYNDEKCLTILAVESRVARLIGKHPNIVDYYGIFVQCSSSFLVQSLEPSLTAKYLFMRKCSLTKEILASVLYGISSGMTFMHQKGFINNNITPGILL